MSREELRRISGLFIIIGIALLLTPFASAAQRMQPPKNMPPLMYYENRDYASSNLLANTVMTTYPYTAAFSPSERLAMSQSGMNDLQVMHAYAERSAHLDSFNNRNIPPSSYITPSDGGDYSSPTLAPRVQGIGDIHDRFTQVDGNMQAHADQSGVSGLYNRIVNLYDGIARNTPVFAGVIAAGETATMDPSIPHEDRRDMAFTRFVSGISGDAYLMEDYYSESGDDILGRQTQAISAGRVLIAVGGVATVVIGGASAISGTRAYANPNYALMLEDANMGLGVGLTELYQGADVVSGSADTIGRLTKAAAVARLAARGGRTSSKGLKTAGRLGNALTNMDRVAAGGAAGTVGLSSDALLAARMQDAIDARAYAAEEQQNTDLARGLATKDGVFDQELYASFKADFDRASFGEPTPPQVEPNFGDRLEGRQLAKTQDFYLLDQGIPKKFRGRDTEIHIDSETNVATITSSSGDIFLVPPEQTADIMQTNQERFITRVQDSLVASTNFETSERTLDTSSSDLVSCYFSGVCDSISPDYDSDMHFNLQRDLNDAQAEYDEAATDNLRSQQRAHVSARTVSAEGTTIGEFRDARAVSKDIARDRRADNFNNQIEHGNTAMFLEVAGALGGDPAAILAGDRDAIIAIQRALGFTGADLDGKMGDQTFTAMAMAIGSTDIEQLCSTCRFDEKYARNHPSAISGETLAEIEDRESDQLLADLGGDEGSVVASGGAGGTSPSDADEESDNPRASGDAIGEVTSCPVTYT